MKPQRIQLSRKRGWRMPPNTVKVDRSTKWGNPFVVGAHGTRAKVVELFQHMVSGYICLSTGDPYVQNAYLERTVREIPSLFGKNLACWCPLDQPCHVDVLLRLARRYETKRGQRTREKFLRDRAKNPSIFTKPRRKGC